MFAFWWGRLSAQRATRKGAPLAPRSCAKGNQPTKQPWSRHHHHTHKAGNFPLLQLAAHVIRLESGTSRACELSRNKKARQKQWILPRVYE